MEQAGQRFAWLNLAWREFGRAFSNLGRPVPGGRDLLGISAISGLLIALISIMAALHQGVVLNFADSLLGYMPRAGVPLQIVINATVGPNRVRQGLQMFANGKQFGGEGRTTALSNYEFHPIHEIEDGAAEIGLPIGSWKPGVGKTPFSGWATAIESPLWSWTGVAGQTTDQLNTIVLSRAAFRDHFDMDRYVETLKTLLPARAVDQWMTRQPGRDRLTTIFLIVPQQDRKEQVSEFRVAWVESFPALQRIAYVLPLETFRALEIARINPGTQFVGTLDNVSSRRAKIVRLYDTQKFPDHGTPKDRVDRLQACLGEPQKLDAAAGDIYFELKLPLPETWVNDCLVFVGLKGNRDVDIEFTDLRGLTIAPGRVEASCADLNNDFLKDARGPCNQVKADSTTRLQISPFWRVDRGLVYSKDRRELGDLARLLVSTRVQGDDRQIFSISELYQNSINRFSYLVQTLDFMVLPSILFGTFVVVYVINFQIATWISHRRKHYGVLLARGLHWYEVYLMCGWQLLLATLVGFVFGSVFVECAKYIFNLLFHRSAAAQLGRYQLGIRDPNLLASFDTSNLTDSVLQFLENNVSALAIILTINIILLVKVLVGLPVRPSTTPIALISTNA